MYNVQRGMYVLKSLQGGATLQLPNPTSDGNGGNQKQATFVNQGRNTQAEVVAQKIGRDQVKLELSWSYLPKEEWENIVKFFNTNFFFNCEYYDIAQAKRITRKFYVGDRDAKPLNVDANGFPMAYVNCVANIIDTGSGQ